MKNLIAIAIVLLAVTTTSFAQTASSTANATASATVVGINTLTKNADLNFGSILSTFTAGNVVMDATSTAAISSYGVSTGNGVAAKFTITGTDVNPKLTWPATVSLVGSGAALSGAAMTLTLACKEEGISTALVIGAPITLTAGGSAVVYLGGSLAVNANQKAGPYASAAFPVTVNY